MFNWRDIPLTGKELRAEFIEIMGEEWVLEREKEDDRIDERLGPQKTKRRALKCSTGLLNNNPKDNPQKAVLF